MSSEIQPKQNMIEPITITKEHVKAFLELHRAVADAIRALGTVPSGHLYARVMEHVSQDQFDSILARLKGAGLVVEDQSHLLRWIGPKLEAVCQFNEADCGGAFDGNQVVSDADPGL